MGVACLGAPGPGEGPLSVSSQAGGTPALVRPPGPSRSRRIQSLTQLACGVAPCLPMFRLGMRL
eukprot:8873362-Pyramimonas_sp.AAC.1